MKSRNLNIVSGIILSVLLILLFIKLNRVEEGTNFSGVVLGGAALLGIILGSLLFSGLIKLIFKRISYLTIVLVTTTISVLVFYIQLHFPF